MPSGCRLLSCLAISSALAGCYSFAVARRDLPVSDGVTHMVLSVRYSDQGATAHTGFVLACALYPVNAVAGLIAGIYAPFDEFYDIQLGPLGVILGVIVPGFTVLPSPMVLAPTEVVLTPPEMATLLAAIDQDGRMDAAFLSRFWSWSDPDRILGVRAHMR